MKLKIAALLLSGSVLVHVYGTVALVLVALKFSPWLVLTYLVLTYMVLAVFTIPAFVVVRLLSPAAVWRKTAAERNRLEQVFIRLYDINLLLAAGIWLVLLGVAIQHEMALRSFPAT
jgi:hypothetical protein